MLLPLILLPLTRVVLSEHRSADVNSVYTMLLLMEDVSSLDRYLVSPLHRARIMYTSHSAPKNNHDDHAWLSLDYRAILVRRCFAEIFEISFNDSCHWSNDRCYYCKVTVPL